MAETGPAVSIVITCYNRAKWVEEAIVSCLEQDYDNLEILISDNHSTDGSQQIIEKYTSDPRIKFNKNARNIGMLANFKKATELATGELITYVSSDDYLVNKSFVKNAALAFSKYPNVNVYSAVSKNLNSISGEIKHNSVFEFKKTQGFFGKVTSGKDVFFTFTKAHLLNFGGSVFYRHDLINSNLFREPNTLYADLQIVLMLSLRGDFYFSQEDTYIQRFHEGSVSAAISNADQAILDLQFAEAPYKTALALNLFEKKELDVWLEQVLKPYILNPYRRFLVGKKSELKKFQAYLKEKHPKIFAEIKRNKNWTILNLLYSNRFTAGITDIILKIKNGRN